jgi:hypothetical protein
VKCTYSRSLSESTTSGWHRRRFGNSEVIGEKNVGRVRNQNCFLFTLRGISHSAHSHTTFTSAVAFQRCCYARSKIISNQVRIVYCSLDVAHEWPRLSTRSSISHYLITAQTGSKTIAVGVVHKKPHAYA